MEHNKPVRCGWCLSDPVYITYHDLEWGMPVHDDRKQFEFLVLESAQAGLSWLTILKRRDGYRTLYKNFDPEMVARFNDKRVAALLEDSRIIRNRMKIESSINNAIRFLEVREEFRSFDNYLWGFTGGRQVVNTFRELSEIPPSTDLSDRIARDMKKRGFRFLGSTIIYAHLQATGLVNDHLLDCFRYEVCRQH